MTATVQAALHAALTVAVMLASPAAERTPRKIAGLLWISACTAAALLSSSAFVATLAWLAAVAPFGARGGFALIFFPAQSRLAETFERAPLPPLVLALNGHLGALVATRGLELLPPDLGATLRPWLVSAALLAALWSAARAAAETHPRRILGRFLSGQGALIAAGLLSGVPAGVAGAQALWMASAAATTMLLWVLTGLEARVGPALDARRFLGLAASAPRFAVFFAFAGFTLADLPLTLGLPAVELLQLGLLAASPIALLLPAVAAINAFVLLRMHARLFWGAPVEAARDMPDALPRERWALSAVLLFLVFGGLFPSALLR